MDQQTKKSALYCRLSKDDEKVGESLSIETQKAMLIQYAKEHSLMPYEIYVDDGYSGLNFERPDFQRMIDDVVARKIHTVITKDLSRLGRDHLTVGQYTEIYFPTHKVRYIAINDNVDTANAQSTDFAALKNVINEFYSRDASRKIKASFRARAKEGKYRSKAAPFGYLKDPLDHNHLIPDPQTAPFVVKIYEFCAIGWGNYRIRNWLRENKVPVPSWYHHIRGIEDKSHMFTDEDSRYIWRPDTLRLLIRNPVYKGDCAMGKSETVFKTNKHPKTDEKNWIVVKDTHEPIVSRDLWSRANELVSVKRQAYKETLTGYRSLFAGLLKCADCGKAMTRRNYGSNSKLKVYVCSAYASYGVYKCSHHKLFDDDLYRVVLADICDKAKLALAAPDGMVKRILKRTAKAANSPSATAVKYKRDKKRLDELNRIVERLYEDSVLGRIDSDNFERMIGKYQSEQKELSEQVIIYEQAEKAESDTRTEAEKCSDLLAGFAGITELTPEILNTLISRIDVHDPKEKDGVMQQDIDIYYRHAGHIEALVFDSSRCYKSDKVRQVSRKRMRGKTLEAAIKNDLERGDA
jgi:DNA invertase Pin-like site-specific DNA recombinase